MNARVLELLQRPENISREDISLLQNEISKFPYMQSIRTLHLSAIFNFDAENYQKELTKTAAYTTDKKILYTFINKKKEEEKKELTKFKKIVLAKAENEVEKNIEEPVNIVEASSKAFVCRDCVPPKAEESASIAVLVILLNGSCSVKDQPEVCECVLSAKDL